MNFKLKILFSFFMVYPLTLLVSVFLCILVEKIRIQRFFLVPIQFFQKKIPVSEKFHQASLLCLSIGIAMASLVILNNEYYKWVYMEKLTLNTFFLGFSLSLIALSLVFDMLKKIERSQRKIIMEICFWAITLGVIIFFILILFEKFIPQVFVTSALFTALVLAPLGTLNRWFALLAIAGYTFITITLFFSSNHGRKAGI